VSPGVATVERSNAASAIRPRRVRFAWEETPLHWIPGDPQSTHTINVLHLLLPAGERWFVEVFRQALPLVDDPQLVADMKGFMGQEAVHSRAHAPVLEHLAAQGLDATPYTRRVDWLFTRLLADRPFGRPLPTRLQRQWLKQRLAIIASVEHFTSVMGDWIVRRSGALDAAGADPTMLDLLRWHGAEEVEHRSVAFDAFQAVSGSRFRRCESMLVTCVALTFLWVAGTRFFMANDPTHPGKARWRDLVRAGRTGHLPTLWELFRTIPAYFGPSFHPSRHGSTEAAAAYLASSPAAIAAARAARERA
jgi:predicted metal-dependent hydrolase